MKKSLIISLLAVVCCACEPSGSKPTTHAHTRADADNTSINERDRNGTLPTAGDQSESDVDLQATQLIREALVKENNLSTTAKNVKIITIKGVVTLRGPVNSEAEKAHIEQVAKKIAGVKNVDNHLEIIKK